MRILNGRELADYVKERQLKQVRNLRQSWNVLPKLAIIVANDDAVIDVFVRLKREYGEDILVDVEVLVVSQQDVKATILTLNEDTSVHGIVLQLPIPDMSEVDELLALIDPAKDIDGLGPKAAYVSATATAIDWLLAGYNVTLKGKRLAIVGAGRLVGAPLARLWESMGLDFTVYDDTTPDLKAALRQADVIVTATGVPGLITSSMISPSRVVVDAGTASENGVIVGDISADVRERTDLTITPEKGGVGPLTIAALFDNVIQAARVTAEE